MHHSSTTTYIPNFIEIEETFCGQMDGHLRLTLLGRLIGIDLINEQLITGVFILSMEQRLIKEATTANKHGHTHASS